MIPINSLLYILYFLSVSVNILDINATGCQLPFESSCVSTMPVATFDASNSIWNGLDWLGIINAGSLVNCFFRVSSAF